MQLQTLTGSEKVAVLAALLVSGMGIASFLSHPADYLQLIQAAGVGAIGVSGLFGGLAPILDKQHASYYKFTAALFIVGGLVFSFAFGLQFIRGF